MPNEKNKNIVKEIKENLEKAKSVIFVDYLGLSADNVSEFRQKMKECDASVVVAKNTLIKKAAEEEKGIKELEKDLDGPTMAIFSFSDPLSPIKAIYEFAKKFELPKTKSALVEGTYKNAFEVEELKDIPSKEELLGRFVGSLGSPVSKFVFALGGIQSKFVFAVNAIANKKAGGLDQTDQSEGGAN
jgi:large subunit ribosomal protein L10